MVIAGLSDACGSWKMSCIRLRNGRKCRSDSPEIFSPSSEIDPSVTFTSESTARDSVVLPLPDSPTSPRTSPRCSWKLTPSTALTEPVS